MDTWAGPRILVVFTIFLAMFSCDYGLSELSNFGGDFGLHDPLGENVFPLAMAHHIDSSTTRTIDSSANQSQKAKTKVMGADDDITSTKTLLQLQKILFCYINPILCAVGCPGNVLCVIVFSRWGCKERVHLCMIVLAILDFFTITTWFGMNFVCFLDVKGEEKKYMQWTLRQWLRGPHHGFMFSSGCMVALMSVERCLCVAFPHKASNSLTTKTMAIIILVIIIFVQVICASFTVDVSVTWVNGTVQLPKTDFFKNNEKLVHWTQDFVAMFLLPFVTMVVVSVATTVTVLVLRRAKKWETAVNKHNAQKRNARVTLIRMLVTVSIIYVVINTTSLILSIARFHWHETFRIGGKYHNTFMALHISYWTLGSVNSAVNFFVYALRSYRFRNDCVKLLPKCLQARAVKALGIETSLISRDVEQSTSNPNKSVFTKFTSVFSVQSTLHDTPVDCGTPVRPGILTENEEQLHRGKKISVTFVNIREGSHDVDFALSKGTCQKPALSPVEDTDNSLRSPEPVANAIPPTDIGEKIGSTEQDFAKIGTLDCIPEVPMKRIASSSVEQDLSSMALDCIPEMPLKRIASSSVEPGLPRIDEGSNYERSITNKAAAQSGMAFIDIRDDLDIEDKIGATEQDTAKIGALDCIPEVQMKRIASSSVESDHSWMPEGSNDEKSDINKAAAQSSMDKSIVDETRTPKEKLSVVSSGTDYNPSEYSGDVPARTRNRTISIIEVVFSEESTTDIPA